MRLRAIPAGPLLTECQGQLDLAEARGQAARLAASMARDGREMSDTSEAEAVGAGCLAVVAWRNGQDVAGVEIGARGVCWRAIVQSVARDSFGESIELWRENDGEGGADCFDSLTGSALPLPRLLGDASRAERAARLLFERARAKRPGLLARRIEAIKAKGGRGRRAASVDRVHRAAVLLLHGESIDKAASAAGFKASGQPGRQFKPAGDQFAQAVRRLGFRFRLNLRQGDPKERKPGGGVFVPMSSATAQALSFHPSALVPLDNGRGGKQRVAKIRRLQRARARAAKLQAARAAWTARAAKRAGKRRDLARAARRGDKAAGLWPIHGAGAGAMQSRTNGYWRGAIRGRALIPCGDAMARRAAFVARLVQFLSEV
jgi:hypothetical protein